MQIRLADATLICETAIHEYLVQTYQERDIRTVYDIGNLREFARFLQLLAAHCAQALNLSVLAADVGVAVNTIKKWVSILEACRILCLLPPYYKNLGKRISSSSWRRRPDGRWVTPFHVFARSSRRLARNPAVW
ncbi:MAG: DUF4143 domain-containing protein [Lentisphaerae bacterium]|nr:DUF4143 domain-containing protein [Lentisphaerota bacterium]